MAQIPDYSDLKMNMSGLNRFFNDQDVKISSEENAKLNSIFKECDTENAKGENKPDGELTGNERNKFLDRIKTALPKLYQKVVDFYTVVDVIEGIQEDQDETKTNLEQLENKSKSESIKKDLQNNKSQFGQA